jgi:hypothetical protein
MADYKAEGAIEFVTRTTNEYLKSISDIPMKVIFSWDGLGNKINGALYAYSYKYKISIDRTFDISIMIEEIGETLDALLKSEFFEDTALRDHKLNILKNML